MQTYPLSYGGRPKSRLFLGQPKEVDSDTSLDGATIEELEWKHPAELTPDETLALRRLPRLGPAQKVLVRSYTNTGHIHNATHTTNNGNTPNAVNRQW